MSGDMLVQARDLVQEYRVAADSGWGHRTTIRPVDHIDVDVLRGETLGLVGESGSGKSTLGRALIRVEPVTSGSLTLEGRDLRRLKGRALRRARPDMQLIFQDPYASLNPRWKAEEIIGDGLRIRGGLNSRDIRAKVAEALEMVGMPASAGGKFAHEFSGGQRQRLGIARALVLHPKLVVADESVSALDVSVQSKVLNLLQDLKRELGLTYVFISHDLAVVRYVSDRVAVMYLGKIVEQAPAEELFANPRHPYTLSLLSAVPKPHTSDRPAAVREHIVLQGDPPSLTNVPSGCRFHSRCPFVQERLCRTDVPPLREIRPGHVAACHWAEDIAAGRIRPRSAAPIATSRQEQPVSG
jgi:peptide/nickel transport system ATP-binding protein